MWTDVNSTSRSTCSLMLKACQRSELQTDLCQLESSRRLAEPPNRRAWTPRLAFVQVGFASKTEVDLRSPHIHQCLALGFWSLNSSYITCYYSNQIFWNISNLFNFIQLVIFVSISSYLRKLWYCDEMWWARHFHVQCPDLVPLLWMCHKPCIAFVSFNSKNPRKNAKKKAN